MPVFGRSKEQATGSLGTIRNTVGVLREIRFDEIRNEAETPPRLLVLAPNEADAQRLAAFLTGDEHASSVTTRALGDTPRDLGQFDAIVVFDPNNTGTATDLQERVPGGGTTPVVRFRADHVDDAAEADRVRQVIVTRLLNRAPAFGRAFPAFRQAAAKAVIDETAKADAQFALVSNAPAVIPVVGGLTAAGADFLVLTKNQLMLIFKVAAIYGRDLHDQWGILREMVPVVGAGLMWRTLAREAASMIPFAAGTIPKVVIAFAGTVAAGRGAEVYYRSGRKPSRDQMRHFYDQAVETFKKLPLARSVLPSPAAMSEPGPPAVTPGDGSAQTSEPPKELGSGAEA